MLSLFLVLFPFSLFLLLFLSPHRIPHPPSPDQMDMHMENRLTCIRAGIRDHAEPAACDACIIGKFARHSEDMSH